MVQVNSPAVDRRPLPDVNMSTGPSPKCTPHFPFPGGELPLGESTFPDAPVLSAVKGTHMSMEVSVS